MLADILLFLTISITLLLASIYLFKNRHKACTSCNGCTKCEMAQKALNDFKSTLN